MKILIVEDHRDSAAAVSFVLKKLNYEPLIAHDCASAHRIAEMEGPPLAICDLGLPDGDGCKLMAELRDLYQVQSIVFTGFGDELSRERCAQAGFDTFVVKPVRFDQLQAAVEQMKRRILPPTDAGGFHLPLA